MRNRFQRGVVAAVVSGGVYALPVIGPHAIFFSGGLLGISIHEYTEGRRPLGWFLMELGLLLGLQAIIGLVCYWGLGKRLWKMIAMVLPWYLGAAVAVGYGLGYAIPALYLVGKEAEPERISWSVVQEFEDVDLFSPDPATRNHFQQASKLLLRSSPRNGYLIAAIPEGTTTLVPVRCDHFATALRGVTPAGAYLYSLMDPPTGKYTWFRSRGEGETAVMESFEDGPTPTLSLHLLPTGNGVAWIEKSRGEPARLWVRKDGEKKTDSQAIELEGTAWQNLVFYDVAEDGQFLLFDSARELVWYDSQGRKTGQLGDICGVKVYERSFLQNQGVRLTWEVYRDNGPCRLAWEIPGQTARVIELLAGKSVVEASLSPDGRWVAASTTTSVNLGNQRDTIVVYETRTGDEVFRIYQPRYTRSEVWFPGKEYFAYTTITGLKAKVVVRRIGTE